MSKKKSGKKKRKAYRYILCCTELSAAAVQNSLEYDLTKTTEDIRRTMHHASCIMKRTLEPNSTWTDTRYVKSSTILGGRVAEGGVAIDDKRVD